MNRKNFIATIGAAAGGAMTGLSRPTAAENGKSSIFITRK